MGFNIKPNYKLSSLLNVRINKLILIFLIEIGKIYKEVYHEHHT